MSVERIPLDLEPIDLPHYVEVLLDETADLLDDWQARESPYRFVPADYVTIYEGLVAIRKAFPQQVRGAFCEWGSGFGLATILAGMIGWRARGVEIQPALVQEARHQAELFGVAADFFEGSFFPDDDDAVQNSGVAIERQDLIYVYPWPDQELEIFDLFHQHARSGALLLTYYGVEDLRLFRKS